MPASGMRTSFTAAWSTLRLDDAFRQVTELHVAVLRELDQELERPLVAQVVPRHDQADGLTDAWRCANRSRNWSHAAGHGRPRRATKAVTGAGSDAQTALPGHRRIHRARSVTRVQTPPPPPLIFVDGQVSGLL